ncbi:transcription factor a [Anaeramoeba ignava]|uniref:Transcription factor a n=1 Tax=Anaeramoeba ignava TaxID=1746090 RepID=A0A9Q0LS65_ANAIG|nr:transcription factor a [Anaeramoeba ignava]|eukprot:Anaeramoba_ignava/a354157_33.p1 GENE.a354157_33~~a354157_33.p1  ORF type:complete len:226 (-),score=110.67 a354157_33:103-780(-)
MKSTKKSKSKDHKKKDHKKKKSNKLERPKKARNPFLLFAADKRAKVMKENPSIRVGELNHKLAELWKNVSKEKKEKYAKKSQEEKAKYEEEMKIFLEKKKQMESESDQDDETKGKRFFRKLLDLEPPKRPKNAYWLYLESIRGEIADKDKKHKIGDISANMSQKWKNLDPQEKEKFAKKAKKEKEKYLQELKAFNEKKLKMFDSTSGDDSNLDEYFETSSEEDSN